MYKSRCAYSKNELEIKYLSHVQPTHVDVYVMEKDGLTNPENIGLLSLSSWVHIHWAKLSPAASALGMFGYFLLLGSIAVVVITKQFPWFTIAPITILLAVAYFRHVEKNELRR